MIDKNLKTRLSTAVVLTMALVILLALSRQSSAIQIVLAAVALVAVLMGAIEFSRFSDSINGYSSRSFFYWLTIAIIPVTVFSAGLEMGSHGAIGDTTLELLVILMLAFLAAVLVACLFLVFSSSDAMGLAIKIAQELFIALLLIGLGGGALVMLTFLPNAALVISWLLLAVCFNDIAAYFTGRRLQGPRLAPSISPNKTISGAVGGLVGGVLLGTATFQLLGEASGIFNVMILSVVVIVAAQCGDLMESFLKRLHGVKESGGLLPGHGGILDRIDGILLAAPFLLFWLVLQGLN